MYAAAMAELQDANQRALTSGFARIARLLEAHSGGQSPAREAPALEAGPGTALGTLATVFGLSTFETDVVILCAGVEMDSSLAALCARAQGGAEHGPSFSLALASLPGAHWSALNPEAPLRQWRLVELGEGGATVMRALRIDERILHFLAGLDQLDERLASLAWLVRKPARMHPSHADLAQRLCHAWSAQRGEVPVLMLSGADSETRLSVAVEASARAGMELWGMPAELIPAAPTEVSLLARLWERESWLDRRAVVVDCDLLSAADPAWSSVQRFAERVNVPLILSGRELPFLGRRASRAFAVEPAAASEQRESWRSSIGSLPIRPEVIDRLAAQFSFSATAIYGLLAGIDVDDAEKDLWRACVESARPRMNDLAQRMTPKAGWDDLVLPAAELTLLRQVAAHGRHRALVQEEWGFAAGGRGLGVSALFEGDSGTGKTMAAEVIAGDLGLDLYRVDLSQVVSKYIGETEKNLRRVFDAAESGGAVVLFDEADAIFGRRSEVRDSHDRYANVEIGYLLQRMEAYRGVAILTTNQSSALDPAFLRRLRFIVTFPFPDELMRERIWQRIFPPQAPVARLDLHALAKLSVAGGSIRNIALHAAFLAAADGGQANMAHVMAAARTEFQKLGRNLAGVDLVAYA